MWFQFPDGEMGAALAVGGITDRAVRVWARDPGGLGGPVTLEVGGRAVAQAPLSAAADRDSVAAADLTLDTSHPNAAFAVRWAGMERRGRLAPGPGEPTAFTFAFGSCHAPYFGAEHQ